MGAEGVMLAISRGANLTADAARPQESCALGVHRASGVEGNIHLPYDNTHCATAQQPRE